MKGSYLGPKFDNSEIEKQLVSNNANFIKLNDSQLIDRVATELTKGCAVGWMQGRMEFGPRALGCRSIIADPRSAIMQKQLNLKVKYRESFRPFAPSILYEDLSDWFTLEVESPYMLLVANVQEDKCIPIQAKEDNLFGIEKLKISRSMIPAVTHVDYSASSNCSQRYKSGLL